MDRAEVDRARVVVTRQPPGEAVVRLSSVADVWLWPHDRAIDRGELLRRVVDARGLYCMLTDRIDAELLDAAPDLVAVSTMAVGVDNIDIASCRARGISIGHTPDVLTDSTADLAWALLMASSRRLGEGIDYVRGGLWGEWEPDALLGHDVAHTTVGIVGMGRIGAGVARRARGFSMDIVYASRSSHPAIESETGARRLTLEELLAVADHVVVCVALNDDTRGLIDAEALALMQPTANLVNVARGPVVDSDALSDALSTGTIRCAALDVTDPEPIPRDHPLVSLPNCLIVPHVGSATERTRIAMADLAADNLIAAIAGRPMPAPYPM